MKKMCRMILSNRFISIAVVFAMVSVLFGTTFSVNVAGRDGYSSFVSGKSMNVNRKKGKIVLDGKANEKAWKNATVIKNSDFSWGLQEELAEYKSRPMKTAKAEGVASIPSCKILWDPNGLYVFIEVKDTTPCVKTKENDPMGDMVEFSFDMTNKKSTAYMGKNDVSYSISRGGYVSGWGELNKKEFQSKSKTINNGKKGFTQEIFVACDWHGVDSFQVGSKVGFDIQVYDVVIDADAADHVFDNVSDRVSRHIVWNSLNMAWANPATMGTLTLVDEPEKSVDFVKKNVVLKKGKTKPLKVKVAGAGKVKFTIGKKDKKVVSLSNKKAKSVVVKGKKKGTAIVQAEVAGEVAKCKVTVK